MPQNPLESLRNLGEQLRATVGEELEIDRLRKQEPARPLEELLAELDSLPGLETVKEQVRALVAFLRVQARRQEAGLLGGRRRRSTSSSSGNPGTGRRPSRGSSRRCTGRWGSSGAATSWRSTARGSWASTSA